MPKADAVETDTTWEIHWRHLNEPTEWRNHYRCFGAEAAEAAVTELRAHPTAEKRRYRVVKVTVTRELVDGGG
jgi:hypothetical protein